MPEPKLKLVEPVPEQEERGEPRVRSVEFAMRGPDGKPGDQSATISLLPDGSADLSKLSPDLQNRFLTVGIPDEAGLSRVFPSDGADFLVSLLALGKKSRNWSVKESI